MTPEQVPDELAEQAKRALIEQATSEEPHLPIHALAEVGNDNLDFTVRVILAAVIPDLELSFVARASNGWESTSGGRVVRYTAGDIKIGLGVRFGLWDKNLNPNGDTE